MHNVKKIDFNGTQFINRIGINKMCLNPHDADSIYQYLMSNRKFINGIERYFFLDTIVDVVYQPVKHSKHKIIESNKNNWLYGFWYSFVSLFYGYTRLIDYKCCGFFSIDSPYNDLGTVTSDKIRYQLRASENAYVEGVRTRSLFYVMEPSLFSDKKNRELLIKNSLNLCAHKKSENFFLRIRNHFNNKKTLC